MRRPNVALQIGELVLHGFAPGDRHRIATAMEREMTRLVAAHGVPEAWSTGPAVMQGRSFTAAPDAKPRTVGTAIARSVYGGVPR
jgi:hypothetical protein